MTYSFIDHVYGKQLWDLAKEGAPQYTDSSIYELGAVIPLIIVIWSLRKSWNSLFSYLFATITQFTKPDWKKTEPEKYREKHNKFCSQMGKLIIHGVAAYWAYASCHEEHWWFFNTFSIISERYSVKVPNDPMTFSHKLYYIVLAAYHTESLLTHAFEEKRDDDVQMWIHHVVTFAVISVSYTLGFTYFGTLVYFVHDVSDVSVAICKCFNYLKFKPVYIGISFLHLIAVWCYTRLYMFSVHIIWVIYKATYIFYQQDYPMWIVACGVFFGLLLSILEILHLYWFYMFFYVAQNLIYGRAEIDASEYQDWKKKEKED